MGWILGSDNVMLNTDRIDAFCINAETDPSGTIVGWTVEGITPSAKSDLKYFSKRDGFHEDDVAKFMRSVLDSVLGLEYSEVLQCHEYDSIKARKSQQGEK